MLDAQLLAPLTTRRLVEVFRTPGAEHYQARSRYAVGQTIALEAFPDVLVEVEKPF